MRITTFIACVAFMGSPSAAEAASPATPAASAVTAEAVAAAVAGQSPLPNRMQVRPFALHVRAGGVVVPDELVDLQILLLDGWVLGPTATTGENGTVMTMLLWRNVPSGRLAEVKVEGASAEKAIALGQAVQAKLEEDLARMKAAEAAWKARAEDEAKRREAQRARTEQAQHAREEAARQNPTWSGPVTVPSTAGDPHAGAGK